MTGQSISAEVPDLQSNVLEHASEFVELVYGEAPAEYQKLLAAERFRGALEQNRAFNHGKLFAYAEFVIFRREFRHRFPDASAVACINAFCRLFLKNDISVTNLVDFLEGKDELGQLLLRPPGR